MLLLENHSDLKAAFSNVVKMLHKHKDVIEQIRLILPNMYPISVLCSAGGVHGIANYSSNEMKTASNLFHDFANVDGGYLR